MNARVIKALILSVVLGWTTPVASQVDFLGSAVTTHPAKFLNEFLWAWAMLLDLGYSYTPIPLYGYLRSDLSKYKGGNDSEKQLNSEERLEKFYDLVLDEAAKGNVNIAVAKRNPKQPDVYSLHGVFVEKKSKNVDKSKNEEIRHYLMELGKVARKIGGSKEYVLIAFTRPLKFNDDNDDNDDNDYPPIEDEFITLPSLWPDAEGSTPSAPPPS